MEADRDYNIHSLNKKKWNIYPEVDTMVVGGEVGLQAPD